MITSQLGFLGGIFSMAMLGLAGSWATYRNRQP